MGVKSVSYKIRENFENSQLVSTSLSHPRIFMTDLTQEMKVYPSFTQGK